MIKIPAHWMGNPNFKTQTKMRAHRKAQINPHISYDIDGDGFVSHFDYCVAKKIDINNDGTLDQHQIAQAAQASKLGKFLSYEFINPGAKQRIIQKRGKVVISQDFSSIQQTYPKLNTSLSTKSRSQMLINRQKQRNRIAFQALDKQDQFSFLLELPKIKEEVNLDSKLVQSSYVEKPHARSFSELKIKRKEELKKQLGRTFNYQFENSEKRVFNRETTIFNDYLTKIKNNPPVTRDQRMAERKKQDMNSMKKNFRLKNFKRMNTIEKLSISQQLQMKYSKHQPVTKKVTEFSAGCISQVPNKPQRKILKEVQIKMPVQPRKIISEGFKTQYKYYFLTL